VVDDVRNLFIFLFIYFMYLVNLMLSVYVSS